MFSVFLSALGPSGFWQKIWSIRVPFREIGYSAKWKFNEWTEWWDWADSSQDGLDALWDVPEIRKCREGKILCKQEKLQSDEIEWGPLLIRRMLRWKNGDENGAKWRNMKQAKLGEYADYAEMKN